MIMVAYEGYTSYATIVFIFYNKMIMIYSQITRAISFKERH